MAHFTVFVESTYKAAIAQQALDVWTSYPAP